MNNSFDEDSGCNKEATKLLKEYQPHLFDDLACAKESCECNEDVDENSSLETAEDFVNCWIDAYYHDFGFDNGLLTFDIKKWGDDGPDTIYYEVEIKRSEKPYQTLYR